MANNTITILTPEVDRNRQNRFWLRDQIYDGPNFTGKIVPNIGDFIWSWTSGLGKVVSVDYENTKLSYIEPVNLSAYVNGIAEEDIPIITSPGGSPNAFRIYTNVKTLPHTLTFDSRVLFFGSHVKEVKVFRGSDITSKTGVVISASKNQQGNIVKDAIPLETVIVPNGTNVAVKTPKPAFVTDTLTNGESVTVVAYTATGDIAAVERFIIVTTDFIRSVDQASKRIKAIELLTPFLSKTNDRLIECPINMVTQGLQFQGKVTYDDGTSRIYPVDGTKFTLAGTSGFVASRIDQLLPLVLIYNLSPGELAFNVTANTMEPALREEYSLRTIAMDDFYVLKLFAMPFWSTNNRYDIRYYLGNLERKDIIDVTQYIEYGIQSPKFIGNEYSMVQQLTVALNMQKLGANYAHFRHVETIRIHLLKPGNVAKQESYYTIGYSETRKYGIAVRGRYSNDPDNAGRLKLDISCGHTDVSDWLEANYRNLEPLYYEGAETAAPVPNRLRVYIGTTFQREIEIKNVLQPITNINVPIPQGAEIRLEFLKVDNTGETKLAIGPMLATSAA